MKKIKITYKRDDINMSKQLIKVVSIFLAVCFLMSITAAAACNNNVENPNLADKDMAGMKLVKGFAAMKLMKEMSQEKNIFIYIKNLVIIKSSGRHPLLRAAVLKNAAENTGDNTGMTENECPLMRASVLKKAAENKGDNTGMTENERPLARAAVLKNAA
jgi:hypothetical protein